MGGKSSSSSSSSTTQTTENYDQRVTVGEGGLGIGTNNVVELTDFGVIEGAAKILEQGLEGAASVVDDVTTKFSAVVESNNKILSERIESDAKEISELMIKIMGMVAGLMALVAIFGGKKK